MQPEREPEPDPVPVADQVGYLVKRTQLAVRSAMEAALSRHGVTMAQYAALAALEAEPGLSNADLSRRAFVTPQTMSAVVADLELAGAVQRAPHPAHGRVREVRLTAGGRAVVHDCHAAAAAVHRRMLVGFDGDEVDRLREALRRCTEALRG